MIFRKYCQLTLQFLVLCVSKLFFLPRISRNLKSILSIQKSPHIIAANHRLGTDPFVIIAGLPFKTFFKIAPINFMTANIFYDSPLKPFAWGVGCYPARNPRDKHRIYGVEGSVKLLKNGFSILMFPEGRRVRDAERGQARHGVTAIHQQAPDIPILICHISRSKHKIRLNYDIMSGQTFNDPEKLMDKIFMLK